MGWVPQRQSTLIRTPHESWMTFVGAARTPPRARAMRPAYDGHMKPLLTLDFVSDVSCPWCAVGLSSLQQAIAQVGDAVDVRVHCRPFELNPQMPPGGQDVAEHLTQKYGSTPEQQAQIREVIRQRGAEVGFNFNMAGRGRIYNTFDAHRLLHWAGLASPQQQLALKMALLQACHRDRLAMDDAEVLLAAVQAAGLDAARARSVLEGGEFADEVREQEAFYTSHGIHAVPAVVINGRHLVSGGQPVAVYAQALRQVAEAP